MDDAFLRKSVIVTGASLGIGRHIALQLALQGARLALAARSEQELSRVASLCRERGGEAVAITTDVSDEAQCKALCVLHPLRTPAPKGHEGPHCRGCQWRRQVSNPRVVRLRCEQARARRPL